MVAAVIVDVAFEGRVSGSRVTTGWGGEVRSTLTVALVDAVPAGSTVVLTGRCASAVSLTRLRADRDVQEVGPRDLAFTPRDVKLRAAAAGVDLDDAAIAELELKRAHIEATLAELRVINATVRNKLETK